MFDPNKPYGRRDGKKCSIKYTFKNGNHFVVLEDTDLYEIINYDGRHGAIDNDADLVNINVPFDPTTPYKRKGRGTMIIKIEYELGQVVIDTTDAPITAMELVGVLEMAKQMVMKKVLK